MDYMTQEANHSSVRVEILGQVFNLFTDPERGGNPDYILRLAEHVVSITRDVAETNPDDKDDNLRLALLAALSIADEYHLLKAKQEEGKETSGEEETTNQAEARQRNRERRQRHYTKRRYEKELLKIANGDVIPTKEQHDALLALGRSRGWNRRPPSKRPLESESTSGPGLT